MADANARFRAWLARLAGPSAVYATAYHKHRFLGGADPDNLGLDGPPPAGRAAIRAKYDTLVKAVFAERGQTLQWAPPRTTRTLPAYANPSRLVDVWERVYAHARRASTRTPRLRLVVGCRQIDRRRRTDRRAFMHTGGGHARGQVHVHEDAATLPLNYLVALFLHEMGHPMALKAWGRTEQEDADRAVRLFLGVKLHYRGPMLLEWVPGSVVRKVMRGG